jgi:hypothetical protein
MKKIALATLLSVASAMAFAGSATIEYQGANGVDGGADQRAVELVVRENVTKTLVGDVNFNTTQTDNSKALSSRIEAGLTPSFGIGVGSGYVRVAAGQKFSNGSDFTYYSIEPGVSLPVGPVTAKVGYRYRSAFDASANGDQTHTARLGVSYALSKVESVGVGFDRVRGDTKQDVWKFAYTRGF